MHNRPARLFLLTALLLFAATPRATAQPAACEYFVILDHVQRDGKTVAVSGIDAIEDDTLCAFMKAHPERYMYLLRSRVDPLVKNNGTRPGTNEEAISFCDALRVPGGMQELLPRMIPGAGKAPALSFSRKELMHVASRVLYCEKTGRKKDGISPACISRTLRKRGSRDYALLEAFCAEAIARSRPTDHGKQFEGNFGVVRHTAAGLTRSKEIAPGRDMQAVEDFMIAEMEKDPDLLAALVEYYNTNRDNLGFLITD
jgi:hypothetical protein